MQDSVVLLIDGMKIENFLSYRIEADIYTADDAFGLDLANPEITVKAGHRCELWINNKLEMTGIVDRTEKSYDKSGLKLKVEGRDLCGLLTDSYCEEFVTVQGMTVKALAEKLLRKVPFINRKNIIYQQDVRGNMKKKKGKKGGEMTLSSLMGTGGSGAAHTFAQVEPGQTIFEVLKTYAMSRGLMFFAMPDGTLVFGRPKLGGEALYHLVTRKSDPSENNVLEGTVEDNISKRYSKITVVGQQQGTESLSLTSTDGSKGATAINTKASVTDSTFPFYKPYVATDNNDSRSPKLRARMLMERMKYEGFSLRYRVPRHTQGGLNWAINEMCRVIDEANNLDGNYLIYGRTFEMSKEGVYTSLRLGHPGLVVE